MPNIKSAKKRVLVNEKKNSDNRVQLTLVKNAIKKINALIDTNNIEEAEKMLPEVMSVLDKAVSKGVMHINTAANKKSGIAKHIAEIKSGKKTVVIIRTTRPSQPKRLRPLRKRARPQGLRSPRRTRKRKPPQRQPRRPRRPPPRNPLKNLQKRPPRERKSPLKRRLLKKPPKRKPTRNNFSVAFFDGASDFNKTVPDLRSGFFT